jgi:hypothetical protein
MKGAAAIAITIAALAAAPSAHADAIDGEWCSAKGLNLMITGPKIRLPSGKQIDGQYARHEFAYQIPAGEDDAGSIIYLQMRDEESMLFRVIKNGTPGEPELWRRCNVTS